MRYRHLDCASIYDNEVEVGQGIRRAIDEGLVKREDLFVVSKLWCTFHAKEHVPIAIARTLADLGELMLIFEYMYIFYQNFVGAHLILLFVVQTLQDWIIWICTSFTFRFL